MIVFTSDNIAWLRNRSSDNIAHIFVALREAIVAPAKVGYASGLSRRCGGWGGIRTHGGREPTAGFKTAALNHPAPHPGPPGHTNGPAPAETGGAARRQGRV